MVPSISPMPAATTPFNGIRPARMATMLRPSNVTASIAGISKARIKGRAIRMKNVRTTAPSSPPNSDEAKAADSARAASPFLASGNPSSTVAWLAVDPGMPSKTLAKVSDVGTSAMSPTIRARPETGSIPNMNGKTSDRPAMPPRPGKTPTDSPRRTPRARNISWCGWKIRASASPNAGRAVAKISMGWLAMLDLDQPGARHPTGARTPTPQEVRGSVRVRDGSVYDDAVTLFQPRDDEIARFGGHLRGQAERSLCASFGHLRVNTQLGGRQFSEIVARHGIVQRVGEGRNHVRRRGTGQEDHLLSREARDEERTPGVPCLALSFARRRRLANLGKGRDVGEGRITHDIAIVVERAPAHHRHGQAGIHQRLHRTDIGRRCLVVDIGFATLEHQAAVTTTLDAEDRLDRHAQHLPCQVGHEVKTRRALRAPDEIGALQAGR